MPSSRARLCSHTCNCLPNAVLLLIIIIIIHLHSEKLHQLNLRKSSPHKFEEQFKSQKKPLYQIILMLAIFFIQKSHFHKKENNFASSRRSGPSTNSHFVSASSCVPPLHLERWSGPILLPEETLDALKTYITWVFLHQLVGFCVLSAEMGVGFECVQVSEVGSRSGFSARGSKCWNS